VEQAIQHVAKGEARLVELPLDTRPPGPREVIGRTLTSAVSPGTELHAAFLGARFPTGSGYAAVFEVDAVGAEVTDLKPGDRAFCLGNHRSRQRQDRDGVVPVPRGLDLHLAPFARLFQVSWTTLVTTAARPPATVVVSGLGVIGHLAAQLFRGAGYTVLGVDPSDSRRALAAGKGLATAAAMPLDDPAIAGQVALVLECSGHEAGALAACQVVRKGGEVVLIGVPWVRRTELMAFDLLHAVFHKYAHLRSGWEWELPAHAQDFTAGSLRENAAGALQWLLEGRFDLGGLYDVRSPGDCQAVYSELCDAGCGRLTTVFDWAVGG
jgi:threonine dehydrogenase-like Zn-dependent dehydrogenase